MKYHISVAFLALTLPFIAIYIATDLVHHSIDRNTYHTDRASFDAAYNTINTAHYTSMIFSGILLAVSCFYHDHIKKAIGIILSILMFILMGTLMFFGSMLFFMYAWIESGGMK